MEDFEEIRDVFEEIQNQNGFGFDETELRILAWLDFGLNQTEIAEELNCCQKTVSNKIAKIKKKYANSY